ncbi:GTP pyrophosphokinase [Candidatus Nitrosotenuis cloacae]|uniref:RelA/SpoT domain-containing protein n=1 Tax=Candidatus Nitrosotenuis cloacae TaxID=1603555 RepID=A0A3G1B1F5_9ARCH|nr:hypothetical protein [Candidatus Nitrosotenuis cloacae]AJZ75472.1 hypothetical protein SU86_002715 [Candidatus Nitrosotenuis cloacae]
MSQPPIHDINWYRENRSIYQELADRVAKILTEILNLNKINYALIQFRAKSIESLQNKTKDPKYASRTLFDLAGIRAVGYVRDDVDKIVKTIKENFDVDDAKSKDKSSELPPDRFGYRAIHLICKIPTQRLALPEYKKFNSLYFEIQIKTILEHAWAEIEHDRNYKYKGLSDDIKRDFYLTAGLLENADNQFDLITKRIDTNIDRITQKTKEGKFAEIEIDPATLKLHLSLKFAGLKSLKPSYGFDGTGKIEVNELSQMGIQNLSQLENIISADFMAIFLFQYEKYDRQTIHNLTSIVFAILIIHFRDKYREVAVKLRDMIPSTFDTYLLEYDFAVNEIRKKISN